MHPVRIWEWFDLKEGRTQLENALIRLGCFPKAAFLGIISKVPSLDVLFSRSVTIRNTLF